jgi:hypothetical protein
LRSSAWKRTSASVIGTKPQFFSHGVVVDVLDDVELAVELREVHEADGDLGALADQLGDAVDALAVEVLVRQDPGDQVHRLREARLLDEERVEARVVGHEDEGRPLEALDRRPLGR